MSEIVSSLKDFGMEADEGMLTDTEEKVKHAYVPDVHGKEKRKREPGKEGLLGVEGIKDDIILDSLKKAGCTIDGSATAVKEGREITKADLYKAGLSGGEGSGEKRNALAHSLGIPMKISANMLLDLLNRLLNYDEFCEIVQNIDDLKEEIRKTLKEVQIWPKLAEEWLEKIIDYKGEAR